MSGTRPALALASMLLVQMLAATTFVAASVLAPAVAPTLGIAPERIGLYAGLGYLAAMISGLRSGAWVARLGAMRLTQLGLACCAAGALLAGLGPPQALLGAAALIGVGYGVVNPTSAAVLGQHSRAWRSQSPFIACPWPRQTRRMSVCVIGCWGRQRSTLAMSRVVPPPMARSRVCEACASTRHRGFAKSSKAVVSHSP